MDGTTGIHNIIINLNTEFSRGIKQWSSKAGCLKPFLQKHISASLVNVLGRLLTFSGMGPLMQFTWVFLSSRALYPKHWIYKLLPNEQNRTCVRLLRKKVFCSLRKWTKPRGKKKKKETCDFFMTFCLKICAVVFKIVLQISVHLWSVLAVLCICWDSSKTDIMLGDLFTTFHPLHLPCSSARWLTFEHISNRELAHKSSLQIQRNPHTSVTLKFLNFRGPTCSSDTSQLPGSLSRRLLTGTREPVTRKHFPAYARGTWIFFPLLAP